MSARIARIALAMTTFSLILGIGAPAATASRSLSLAPAGPATFSSNGLLSFRYATNPLLDAHCLVQLTGTLASTMRKAAGAPAGTITSASISTCTDFHIWQVDAQPLGGAWTIQYRSFSGRLPSPSLVIFRIEGMSYAMQHPAFPDCLFRGNLDLAVRFSGTPNASGLAQITSGAMPSTGSCPDQSLIGSFALTPRQTLLLIN